MNCIIIDDDKVSRMVIEKYVAKTDFLELKGSFDNAVDAINYMRKNTDIELIFLDIEMPEMSGVEFIESFGRLPDIIIISAKEKYALQAIEYNVTDYLLKPVTYARFYKAVSKSQDKNKDENIDKISPDGVFIKSNTSSYIRLLYDEILWIEALENYVVVNTFEDKHTIHFTMKSILDKLPSGKFKRVHRSFIVNVDKIKLIEDNTIVIKIKNEIKNIPIAKTYKDDLMNDINIVSK